jgi:hypothetical protein
MAQKLAGQSRREFLKTAGIAGATMAAGVVRDAAADHGLDGKWEVVIRWRDRGPIKVFWNLHGDGTFASSDGFGGTWTQSGSLLLVSVRSETHPAFAGIAKGQSVHSGVALQPGGIRGHWSAQLLP